MNQQSEKLKAFARKIFVFDKDSDYFMLIKYYDKICTFDIWENSKLVKLLSIIPNAICLYALKIVLNELFSSDIKMPMDVYADKFFMCVGLIFLIFRLLFLKVHFKSFSKATDFLNRKSFKADEEYAIKLRKMTYERNNRSSVAILIGM